MCDNCGIPEVVGAERVLRYKFEDGREEQYRTRIKSITREETVYEVIEGPFTGETVSRPAADRPKRYVN